MFGTRLPMAAIANVAPVAVLLLVSTARGNFQTALVSQACALFSAASGEN
jgi:hypothetical protein